MLITSKAEAKKKGRRTSRFDKGKYKWTGSLKDYIGMEVPDYEGIHAVYAERRKDSYGPFTVLIAVHD